MTPPRAPAAANSPPRQGTASAPLRAVAEVASAAARSGAHAATLPSILSTIERAVHGTGAMLWIGSESNGLQAALAGGHDATSESDALLALRAERVEGLVGVPLRAAGELVGVITVHVTRRLSDEQSLFLHAAADILAPMLSHARHAEWLEAQVASRSAEVEQQRRFMAKVIDSLPVGLYVIDRQFRIQAWNHKRETGALGVRRGEALGRPIFDVLHRQPADILRREFDDVFETGCLQQFHLESTSSGEVRTYRISKIPMRLDGDQVSHVITIGEDITDWRDAQERIAQTEKLAAVGTLAAGVMHEINNPLATIGACAEATALRVAGRAADLPDLARELGEAFALVTHEVQRCKRIIDTVLDFSRPKPSTRSLVNINDLIDRTLFLLKHHPRFKRLSVVVDADASIGADVLADEEQLIQVFMALLLNAVDAMDEQGTVTLRTRSEEGVVVAEVIDEGVGIRRADLNKIFEPFYTTKPPGRGTGLGLSVCYAIVSAHGGSIEVDSAPDAGSAFRILLPRHKKPS